jgi:Anti-sigma factor NepR
MEQPKKPIFSKRTPDEWRDWSYTKDRIGQQLKAHYQACTTEELPPRLVELLKKLDHELPEKQNQ